MTAACLVGSTGFVGSRILSILSEQTSISSVDAYCRGNLPTTSSKVKSIAPKDSAAWPSEFPPNIGIFFSALGTTRKAAGGIANQRKVDVDLNLDLAKAAKAAGVKTYVLISSAGSDSSSMFFYPKMKGELEDAVKALDFDHTVIVRPGFIYGVRPGSRLRPEFFMTKIAGVLGVVSEGWLKDPWTQDAGVIAKAAVSAGLKCLRGEEKAKVVVLSQPDVVRFGRTEWKG